MRGEAEAYAIEVKAKAEAEQVRVASCVLGDHHGGGHEGGHDGDYSGGKVREYGVCFSIGFLIFELNSNAKSIALSFAKFPKKSTEAPLFTQMAKKADAWKEYEEAALVDMMLKVA